MVLVNGDEIPVYRFDTVDSVIKRIATLENTLPKYLYFAGSENNRPSLEQFQNLDTNIAVEDVFKTLTSATTVSQLSDITAKLPNLDFEVEVFPYYVIYNKKIQKLETQRERLGEDQFDWSVTFASRELGGQPGEAIWNLRKSFVQKFEGDREKIRLSVEDTDQTLLELDSAVPVRTTVFFPERSSLEFNLDLQVPIGSILQVFNYISVNTNVPFAHINHFFKILKDSQPDHDWVSDEVLDNVIILQIVSTMPGADPAYISLTIQLTELGVVQARLGLSTSKSATSPGVITERILSAFPTHMNVSVEGVTTTSVNGTFYLPNRAFTPYILSDLVMNNDLFASVMVISEKRKTTKDKTSVYIRFFRPDTGRVNAIITQQTVVEETSKSLKPPDFTIGSSFVRIKITNARDTAAVYVFQEIVSKLFAVYDNLAPALVSVYQEFITGFEAEQAKVPGQVGHLKLKDVDQNDVFAEYYSRSCREERQPYRATDAEAAAASAEGRQVLVFPRPASGMPVHNYVCDPRRRREAYKGDAFVFPGLQKNNQANKNVFPVVPCCYQLDQRKSKSMVQFSQPVGEGAPAVDEIDNEPSQRAAQSIYKTGKIVPANTTGDVSESVNTLFEIIDQPPDGSRRRTLRRGMARTKSSFLDCIITALENENDDRMRKTYGTEKSLALIREKLATEKGAALCKQEMFDYNVSAIQLQIADPNVYFDPRRFVSLLENAYGCDIYIFSKLEDPNTAMVLPYYRQAHYKNRRRGGPSIAILEHMGSEKDHAEYPQCELIMRWNVAKDDDLTLSYSSMSNPAEGLFEVFERLRKAYVLDKLIPLTFLPISREIRIENQAVDSYGKCRMIIIQAAGISGTLFLPPVPPFAASIIDSTDFTRVSIQEALDIAAALNMRVTGQGTQLGVVKEIRGTLGNVEFITIPTLNGEIVNGVPDYNTEEIPDVMESSLIKYDYGKKMARYIEEYLLWLYSKFVGDDGDLSDESILVFRDRRILLDPDFEYGTVTEVFSEESGVMKDGKLVVKSEDTLKRLMYVLRLACVHESQRVRDFKTYKSIQSFYMNINDFDKHPFEVIVYGKKTMMRWIDSELAESAAVHTSILVYVQTGDSFPDPLSTMPEIEDRLSRDTNRLVPGEPYFFKNPLVGPDMYLAQNIDNIWVAMGIAKTWNRDGYNPGPGAQPEALTSFTLYIYVNEEEITNAKQDGVNLPEFQPSGFEIKILGYKILDKSFYTVLLPL
jgi:hypothetical protein